MKPSRWRAFADARAFVRTLGLKSQRDWQSYAKSADRPTDIPSTPASAYRSEFQGYGDWLGTGNVAPKDQRFRPFAEAREFARALGLKNQEEWAVYAKSAARPSNIPASPRGTYGAEFKGFGDWLGTGTVATHGRTYLSFNGARAFVRTLGLTDQREWRAYAMSADRPADIPKDPWRVYSAEFTGLGDWLGTGTVATTRRTFLPFAEAREFVRALELIRPVDFENTSENTPDQLCDVRFVTMKVAPL